MVLEIAQFEITPGLEEAFEAGVKQAVPLFQRAKGCIGLELGRSVEKPSRYRLFVQREMLEGLDVVVDLSRAQHRSRNPICTPVPFQLRRMSDPPPVSSCLVVLCRIADMLHKSSDYLEIADANLSPARSSCRVL